MPQLNAFGISGLLIIISYTPLLIFLLTKGKNLLSLIYSLHVLAVIIWGFYSVLIATTQNLNAVDNYLDQSHIGIFFIPVFFIHAVFIKTQYRNNIILWFCYLQAIISTCLLFVYDNIIQTRELYGINYYDGNAIYVVMFILWASIFSAAHFKLIHFYTKNHKTDKTLITLLYLSVLGCIGGLTNFFPTLGIDIYPVGNYFVPLHSLVVTYAIFKYQFLDIQFIYKKGVVYSILIILILLFYALTILIVEKAIQTHFGYTSFSLSIITALIIGLITIPLRNKIQYLVDKYFFKGDPQKVFEENVLLRQEVAQTEKLKAVATLASGLAHEIRNPLTAIQTFSEHVNSHKHDDEFLKKFQSTVLSETNRINDLLSELLSFAKPETPEFKIIHLDKIIDKILTLLDHRLRQNGIELTKTFARDTPAVLADGNLLHQAFLNIILNAIDAMPKGGKLSITAGVKHNKFLISIKDTGCGIDAKDLKQIFDPFFSKKPGGTGLGLAITHGIIEQHKGKITVKSKVNAGTEFSIHLPVHDERGPHAAT